MRPRPTVRLRAVLRAGRVRSVAVCLVLLVFIVGSLATCGEDVSSGVSTVPGTEPTIASPVTEGLPATEDGLDTEGGLDTETGPLPETGLIAEIVVVSTEGGGSVAGSSWVPGAVTVTVLYDNTVALPGTRADWGFACLVTGFEQTVLFDTGADGGILTSNMEVLQIVPQDLDVVVLSHEHGDHIGGLGAVVAQNPDITVYHPSSFSERSTAAAREAGATLVPVEGAVSPGEGLTVTAPTGSPKESALLLETAQGQVLVVGCAHPGVVEMVKAASDLTGRPVLAVLGGFHLLSHSVGEVDRIIQSLRGLGVERCGPAHCTGEAAIARLQDAFGDGAIEMGVGSRVTF